MAKKWLLQAKHPMQHYILSLFENGRIVHDRITLMTILSGIDPSVPTVGRAYLKVAEDILTRLEAQGFLYRDKVGWYYLNKSAVRSNPTSDNDNLAFHNYLAD